MHRSHKTSLNSESLGGVRLIIQAHLAVPHDGKSAVVRYVQDFLIAILELVQQIARDSPFDLGRLAP